MEPLKYLFEKLMLLGRVARWNLVLAEFGITYITQKSINRQSNADHLVENRLMIIS